MPRSGADAFGHAAAGGKSSNASNVKGRTFVLLRFRQPKGHQYRLRLFDALLHLDRIVTRHAQFLSDKCVEFVLIRERLADSAADALQCRQVGILQAPQVGCVHLRMPAELAEVGINQRRIEVRC